MPYFQPLTVLSGKLQNIISVEIKGNVLLKKMLGFKDLINFVIIYHFTVITDLLV